MYVVEFCNRNNYNPCGSDYTRIYKKLKTIKSLSTVYLVETENIKSKLNS